jgi:SAM-dependent methyltransferase
METFHYFVENPRELDLEGIAEHLPPSVQYASVDPILKVRLLSETMKEDNVAFVNRPDLAALQAHLPFRHHISFRSNHSIQTWLAGAPQTKLIAQIYHNEAQYDLLTVLLRKNPQFREKRENKLARIAGILACPYCKTGLARAEAGFVCMSCARAFPVRNYTVDFLTQDLREHFSIVTTDNISDHGYESRISQAIESHPDKLFIDVGSGFKYAAYDNVVNFEIADYASTDVLGVGEQMPFLSGVFDFVISQVVLEHVKDPFACASEMTRILKPGGELFCSAPFLQPRHAYPNHYYNMTREGLCNLFSGLTVLSADVPDYLHPMSAVTWLLGDYAAGLPENLRKQFLAMPVEEILNVFLPWGKSNNHPLFTQLSSEVREIIACGNFIHAQKPI